MSRPRLVILFLLAARLAAGPAAAQTGTAQVAEAQKTASKLFDFFGNCEYIETEFNYDEVLKLPRPRAWSSGDGDTGPGETGGTYEHLGTDIIASVREETIGYEGMKCTSSDQTGQFGAVS